MHISWDILYVRLCHYLSVPSHVVIESQFNSLHYDDVTMSLMASQITRLTIVYSTVYSGADQRKHQSPASLAFVRGIHRGPVNSPHKWPVTRKMFPFDDVIMENGVPSLRVPYLQINCSDFTTRQDIKLLFFVMGAMWTRHAVKSHTRFAFFSPSVFIAAVVLSFGWRETVGLTTFSVIMIRAPRTYVE